MTKVSWSRWGDEECVRLFGLAAGADVRVYPHSDVELGDPPAMAVRVVRDGDDTCIMARFGFVDGISYKVVVDGVTRVLHRPQPDRLATTEVLDIFPSTFEVPRNLLRFYVWFSAPMGEGQADECLQLTDDAGEPIRDALFPAERELWDSSRRQLTVLLDPARIKRGLVANREIGYPLRVGMSFRLVVDGAFRDGTGAVLRSGAERRYKVGGDERRLVDPDRWVLSVPTIGTSEALEVSFDRPLDHSLLAHCVRVTGTDGHRVDGTPMTGDQESSWRFVPGGTWEDRTYSLAVDSILEDLAGNSISRVLDRDLANPADNPKQAGQVAVSFRPMAPRSATG